MTMPNATLACHFSQLTIEFHQSALFPPLTGSLFRQKNALIGPNGRGKSVLMRLLASQLTPTYGKIDWHMPIIHVDQLNRLTGDTIAQSLGIDALWQAFSRIEQGNGTAMDFDLTEDNWHLPTTWKMLLESAQLMTSMDTPIEQLSGGERTRLALCRAFLHPDHFLLLDEPDNHLDQEGRRWLSDKLDQHKAGCLVISHNRQLLEEMDAMFELTDKGLVGYGGNYTLYDAQKTFAINAIEAEGEQLDKQIRQEKKQQQATLQKAAQRRKQGENRAKTGRKYPLWWLTITIITRYAKKSRREKTIQRRRAPSAGIRRIATSAAAKSR